MNVAVFDPFGPALSPVALVAIAGLASISGFRFVEMSIISTAISILACPFCFDVGHLKLREDLCQKKGLSFSLVIR